MNNPLPYRTLAWCYDRLMADAPYQAWLDFLLRAIREEFPDCRRILDLGCGTGRLIMQLAKMGYQVTGVDLSEEMLAVASERMREADLPVLLIHQDMRELQLNERFDCIYSFCDSLNYLLSEEEIRQTFRRVSDHLVEGGLFLFDVHTPRRIAGFAGESPLVCTDDDVAYIWFAEADPEQGSVEHELHFFVRERGHLYRRFMEIHRQRAYALEDLSGWLREAGLETMRVTADFTKEPPGPESERALFLAKKRKIS